MASTGIVVEEDGFIYGLLHLGQTLHVNASVPPVVNISAVPPVVPTSAVPPVVTSSSGGLNAPLLLPRPGPLPMLHLDSIHGFYMVGLVVRLPSLVVKLHSLVMLFLVALLLSLVVQVFISLTCLFMVFLSPRCQATLILDSWLVHAF